MAGTSTSTRPGPYLATVAGIVIVLGAVAVLTGGGATDFEVVVPDTVHGQALAPLPTQGSDPAAGAQAPRASGRALLGDGSVELPVPDQPTVVVFLAHWCSHCRAEVPEVQRWLSDDDPPDGVVFRAVATGIDQNRPNYPPDEWLEGEEWTVPTMIDDGSVGDAFGVTGYPFWVFVDGDGTVVARAAGSLEIARLEATVDALGRA